MENVTLSRPAIPMEASTAALLDNVRAQLAGGRAEWETSQLAEAHIPVERYFDPAIWRAEVQALFRSLPLIVAHSSELAPGHVMTHDAYGVPLLLGRDADGTLSCMLNVCRHRGMRLVDNAAQARPAASLVCPYHGWTYRLDGALRHLPHASAFDTFAPGARALVALPCTERHGLIWVLPEANATLDLDSYLGGLNAELQYLGIDRLQHFRTIECEVPANWKLIIDAFLESYHIRVLHKDTIYPFFADGITAAQRFGPHIYSLVARRAARDWALQTDSVVPDSPDALRKLVTPTQMIFPNTVTIFHPDYLSLITVYPSGPETLRWVHRMLIPANKATPDWTPHWDKTFRLIEQGVFQKEDIHCAVGIQQGLKTGANTHLAVGRLEQALAWFHEQVHQATEAVQGRR